MGRTIKSYQDLDAWQAGYALAKAVYKATAAYPAEERCGLTQQMRRAAVSIPSNIAEGWGRQSTQDYLRFLRMSRGSVYELETQVNLGVDLGFGDAGECDALKQALGDVSRLLNGLITAIDRSPRRSDA